IPVSGGGLRSDRHEPYHPPPRTAFDVPASYGRQGSVYLWRELRLSPSTRSQRSERLTPGQPGDVGNFPILVNWLQIFINLYFPHKAVPYSNCGYRGRPI